MGLYIKHVRLKAGLTQGELALKSGVPVATISLAENMGRWPNVSSLYKLSKALNVPMEELCQRTPEEWGKNSAFGE